MTTDAVGGVWRYSIDLASGMRQQDVPVRLAVLGPPPSPAQCAEAARHGVKLLDTGLPLDWTAATPAELAQTTAALQTLAEQPGTRSVHCHAAALVGALPWRVPVITVAHSCTATWWHAVRGGALPPDFTWRAQATAAGLRSSNVVVAPTQAHAAALRTIYGAMPITVVHNGSNPAPKRSDKRESAVLTGGRLWDDGKNAAALDAAAARLDAPVYAAGSMSGPNGSFVRLDNLRHLGELDPVAMAAAYARCTVFASFARYEPFGLSVLEAAGAGMRLVLSDIPTFRELWDGVASFVPLSADPVPALRRALAAPDPAAMARAARYDLRTTVDATLGLHRQVGAFV